LVEGKVECVQQNCKETRSRIALESLNSGSERNEEEEGKKKLLWKRKKE